MITAGGMEGGPVYTVSAAVGAALEGDGDADARCAVTIDLHPDLDAATLADRWRHRRPGDSISSALRRTLGLSPVGIALLREAVGREMPTDADELARLVKAVPLAVHGLAPIDRAISSAGGISLDEVDESFMMQRMPGVFVAGEMLDWDAPTGGYLLQAAFSTGVAAARGAVRWVDARGLRPPA